MSQTDAEHTLARIDALIGPEAPTGPSPAGPGGLPGPDAAVAVSSARHGGRLAALARRAAGGASPPPGEVLVPAVEPGSEWSPRPATSHGGSPPAPGANMGAPSVRIDHWDAYVCRFDDGGDGAGPDRYRL